MFFRWFWVGEGGLAGYGDGLGRWEGERVGRGERWRGWGWMGYGGVRKGGC